MWTISRSTGGWEGLSWPRARHAQEDESRDLLELLGMKNEEVIQYVIPCSALDKIWLCVEELCCTSNVAEFPLHVGDSS
jgi:hypothetical protein